MGCGDHDCELHFLAIRVGGSDVSSGRDAAVLMLARSIVGVATDAVLAIRPCLTTTSNRAWSCGVKVERLSLGIDQWTRRTNFGIQARPIEKPYSYLQRSSTGDSSPCYGVDFGIREQQGIHDRMQVQSSKLVSQ